MFAKFREENQELSLGSSNESDYILSNDTIAKNHAYLSKRKGKIFMKPNSTQFGTSKYQKEISINPHQEYELQINNTLLNLTLRKNQTTPKPKLSPSPYQIGTKRKFTVEEFQTDSSEEKTISKRKVSSTGNFPH